ncbi:Membrane-bound lytic murein transglycosylase B precursor [Jannaschia seosinensis]|uniref:Membrane-bound lytic murein transglycosylase B n=1 Tax=Jannaschia seosinensis TaxID=313367 RepID=A0A0M7B610_9RHOB|nr:lytic murein transglycosylase [Jannaschia seosinensis]CUH15984.1 Membrane-bound lytic murein transglycosylase B precursor [Jannaschia seosinensis]
MRALLVLLFLALPAAADIRPVARPERAEAFPFAEWVAGFRDRALAAGLTAPTFDAAMADVEYLPNVIRLDRRQSEFTKTIWDYLDAAASDTRVRNGRQALDRHAATFDVIEARHGVPREVVAAIWGLETSYGAVRGDTPTLSALATLAADSRRGAFFEEQLLDALRILDQGEAARADLRGSWAGAMGHTQFLPSSWHAHAVDHDGDGRRDIWGADPADALASTAAYLVANGWVSGQPWGAEVILPEGFDYRLTGERVEKTAPEWAALGVRTATGAPLPEAGPISIRVPGGHEGAAFATYGNFRALESYNTADAYVIAVGHLSDRLAGGGPLVGGWPRGDRALSYDERIALQEGLRAAGFDPLRIDARIGPDTLDAIQRWQASEGLAPDGYIDADLLARLLR